MIYRYNKLVRDKIPDEINNKSGKKAIFRILNDDEYADSLNKKLLEEANEFIEANSIEELADVMEVIESIVKLKNIDWNKVKEFQKIKRNKKGGFSDRKFLEYVEEEIEEKI